MEVLNRRRRIVDHMDADDPQSILGSDFKKWLDFRFRHADMPDSQIDSIWWDIGSAEDTYAIYDSSILQKLQHERLERWWNQGIDYVAELVAGCRKRNIEAFWSARMCSVDFPQPWDDSADLCDERRRNPLKQEHPDWINPCWWWNGLWTLSSEGYRKHRVSVLRELAEKYDFDGFQIDFARHMPCLPLGRQWELRDHATTFIRMVREMLLEVEQEKDSAILLAVKVPENLAGCHTDGLEVERWARELLVDIFVLGGRTNTVDVDGFRQIVERTPVKLCPTWDAHHSSDGYCSPSLEVLRGVFSNWWSQGADSVAFFNWPCAPREGYESFNPPAVSSILPESHPQHTQAVGEIGCGEILKNRDKTFFVERRGGFPWADEETYHCRNLDRPLPRPLPNYGAPVELPWFVYEDIAAQKDRIRDAAIYAVFWAMFDEDTLEVQLNGKPLRLTSTDREWKDAQIYGDKPQPNAGSLGSFVVDPEQKLVRLRYAVDPEQLMTGENTATIRVVKRGPYPCGPGNNRIKVEKVELTLHYA